MNFHVLTLFPEMIEQGMHTSIIGRAIAGGYLSIDAINIRDYAFNKHQKVDDYPYGGGAGMLMQAEPVYLAYESIQKSWDIDRGLFILLHREKYFIRQWQRNWQRRKILFFFVATMKELMSVFLMKLLPIMYLSEICTYRRRTPGHGNDGFYFANGSRSFK